MVISKLQNKVKEVLTKKRPGGLGVVIASIAMAVLVLAIIAAAQTPLSTYVTTMITNLTTKTNGILGI